MKTKVMIVDDEPDVLDTIRMILEKQGFDITVAESGFECLEKIKKGFKGVVLMDIMMPEMNGWETIKKIIENDYAKDVAIEIISALGIKENKNMGQLDPYIYDYLAKPIDIIELIDSIKKCSAYLYAKNNEK